jgi:YggT family protein
MLDREEVVTRRVETDPVPQPVGSHDEVVTRRAEPPPAQVASERVEAMSTDPYDRRRDTALRLQQGIYLVFGIVEGLIAIRFVLRLLGANPAAGFASFIYGVTAPFLAPFVGMFGTPSFDGTVLELHSIVAIVVYALIAWVLAKIVKLTMADTRTAVHTRASRVDTELR